MQNIVRKIDNFQQTHKFPGFIYAVIKKYGEDEAGSQAALLTYYAFLSLFPLLLVVTTLTEYISTSHSALQTSIINGTTNYFPVLGNQLSAHVETLHKNGLALLIGVLFTVYGARGVANAFQNSVLHLWRVPKAERTGFPKSILKSLAIILVAGVGFLAASASIALASANGHGMLLRVIIIAINFLIWLGIFMLLLYLTLPAKASLKEVWIAALWSAVGLCILQTLGGYLLKRELQHLDALYSYFALALGLLFWIYLQVQVFFYALEIAVVHTDKLWPRALTGQQTAADKRSKPLYAHS